MVVATKAIAPQLHVVLGATTVTNQYHHADLRTHGDSEYHKRMLQLLNLRLLTLLAIVSVVITDFMHVFLFIVCPMDQRMISYHACHTL